MPEEVKGEQAASPSGKEGEETPKVDGDSHEEELGEEETPPQGDLHKSERWKKVYSELKSFKEAGLSPLEVKAAMQRLAEYDRLAEEAAKREDEGEDEGSDSAKELKAKRNKAKKQLVELVPEFEDLLKNRDRQNLYYTSLERRATKEAVGLMKSAGLPTDDKKVAAMTEVLTSIIANDEDLYDEYIGGNPRGAVKGAFEQFTTGFKTAAERSVKAGVQKDKLKQAGLPKVPRAGGSPELGEKRSEGPKNLNEARKIMEARLAALEGD